MNPRKSKTSTTVADPPNLRACSNPDPRPPSRAVVSSRIGEERKPSKYFLDPTRTTARSSSSLPVVFPRKATVRGVDVGGDDEAIPLLPGTNATAKFAHENNKAS